MPGKISLLQQCVHPIQSIVHKACHEHLRNIKQNCIMSARQKIALADAVVTKKEQDKSSFRGKPSR